MSNILNDTDLQQLATLYAAAQSLATGSKEYWQLCKVRCVHLRCQINQINRCAWRSIPPL